MMEKLPWHWKFFDALTGGDRSLPYDPERAVVTRGYRLEPSEIGCFESHLMCIREHATSSSSAEYLVVLEDDVLIDPNFQFDCIPRIMSEMDIHYLKLYSRFITRIRWLGRIKQRSFIRFVVPPCGNQAYVVSKLGAQQFVRSISRIDRPIDDEMDRYWSNGLPTYALFPYPVLEMNLKSTVEKGFTRAQSRSLHQMVAGFGFTWFDKIPREYFNIRLKAKDRAIVKKLREIEVT